MSITSEQLIVEGKNVPLHALNMSVRSKLGTYLDPEGFVTGDYSNDYQGLAEVIGFTFQDITNFQRQSKPTQEMLYQWGTRPELSPTVDNLIKHLQTIGRSDDVITECAHLIKKDVDRYKQCHKDITGSKDMIQDPSVSQGPNRPSCDYVPESDKLGLVTIDDVKEKGDTLYYDAFVIYNPVGKDLEFVKELAGKMESPPYNLKFCIPWRDDLPGGSRYEVSAHMIATRCRRTLVILSSDFLKSAAADFQLKFAHCLSPGARSKKVVPVFSAPCKMPDILRAVSFVDFTNPGLRDWNWPRLNAVLRCPLNPDPRDYMSEAELEELKLNAGVITKRMWYSTGVLTMNFPEESEDNTPYNG
ncbi:myeloid differentiation primary response protein MyD88-like [Crassostrea angulata]|uniref:myeloid differentiation primary response protein MyD88-like n=1 Tax=Magallana angulata TaxID=2784310 RepID=UPI0022B0F985|nr:myeloid differentiation primary response protein MyD88-like [Crassostrea angulata]XP_052683955.1 myeloid differentiation primary response protein MyD88-like [Crassostrea angulata]